MMSAMLKMMLVNTYVLTHTNIKLPGNNTDTKKVI